MKLAVIELQDGEHDATHRSYMCIFLEHLHQIFHGGILMKSKVANALISGIATVVLFGMSASPVFAAAQSSTHNTIMPASSTNSSISVQPFVVTTALFCPKADGV